MTSDHFPVSINLSLNYNSIKHDEVFKLDYKRADWSKFRSLLDNTPKLDKDPCVDTMNDLISSWIVDSTSLAIPSKSQFQYKSSLHREIISLIKERRLIRRRLKKDPMLKSEYNSLTSRIRLKNENWLKFIRETVKSQKESPNF
ncbi:RNA-directed DNA polymerase from mobile element jockey-like [Brachionus plicatilis]|uniref:RNA-directed DNA polymerase from mobile element jockey-like n=1 Tax=Brachionus plicatilis TaxID=10195 RepID=A0A3M7SIE5_BRAPC|nr:RNA-directed DNA polymerase from mobile element jockey-like [Brachionus plicatilis]